MRTEQKNGLNSPDALADYLIQNNAELIAALQKKTEKLSSHNAALGYATVSPFAERNGYMPPEQALPMLLTLCYGQDGFPIKAFTQPDVIERQIVSGVLKPWMIYQKEHNIPVGTSSLRFFNNQEWTQAFDEGEPIVVELARSASLPQGQYETNIGMFMFTSDAKITALMHARMLEFLSGQDHAGLLSHPTVFGDARAAAPRTLKNGRTLPGGAITLHSIHDNGLSPFALHASYSFGSSSTDTSTETEGLIREPLLKHYLHVDGEGSRLYMENNPVLLPDDTELTAFVAASLQKARYRVNIETVPFANGPVKRIGAAHNSVYYEIKPAQNGNGVTPTEMAHKIENGEPHEAGLVTIDAVSVNMPTIYNMIEAGFVPTGIIPGTRTMILNRSTGKIEPYVRSHKLVLNMLPKGSLSNAPELNLPKDYDGTALPYTIGNLWDKMRYTFG